MKAIRHILLTTTVLAAMTACQTTKPDSVAKAKELNNTQEKINPTNLLSPESKQFIVEMADSRMLGIAEGQQAAVNGKDSKVRDYGNKTIADETAMLDQLRQLATDNQVTLPEHIGDDKKNALDDLEKAKGRKLDKKFLSMIKKDHEHDVKAFSDFRAKDGYANDDQVAKFAVSNLGTLQKDLDEAQDIQKHY